MKIIKPRVVHIVAALFGVNGGVVGGAERYALELARYMADEVPTRLVTFGARERHERIGNLAVRVIGNPWHVRGQRANPISLSIFPELLKADVVHCHQQHMLASSFAAAFCRLTRRRVFVTDLGGGGFDVSAYVSTDSWYHGHLHLSEYSRRLYGHSEKHFAHVILGGVDVEKFSPGESAARNGSALFVGRLLPHKGVDQLINAIPAGMELQLIGHEFDEAYLKDLHQLSADKRVSFRHDCDDSELVDAYRHATCVVLPSVYRTIYGSETRVPELLGQTLLEGMACATPVICTNVASMPEIVENGVSGFVVPPNDPAALRERICWLRAHPVEAAAMGREGRRRVLDKFTWPQVVQRCLEIYRS